MYIDIYACICVFQVRDWLLPLAILPQVLQRRLPLLPQVSPYSACGKEKMLLTPDELLAANIHSIEFSFLQKMKRKKNTTQHTYHHHLIDVIMYVHEISCWTLQHTLEPLQCIVLIIMLVL